MGAGRAVPRSLLRGRVGPGFVNGQVVARAPRGEVRVKSVACKERIRLLASRPRIDDPVECPGVSGQEPSGCSLIRGRLVVPTDVIGSRIATRVECRDDRFVADPLALQFHPEGPLATRLRPVA